MITLGHRSYTNGAPIFQGTIGNVHVGNFTSIGQGVTFDCGMSHNILNVSTYPFYAFYPGWQGRQRDCTLFKGDIHIGSDVYIGEYATVMGGVTIGDGAVIGLRAVVTKNVPPYAIVAGNPGEVKKYRFDEKTIKKLLELKWWDRPEEWIEKNIDILTNPVRHYGDSEILGFTD